MRLLLVEDDTKLVRALTLGLEREGYVVDAAESGDLAMELARATDYDGIVLDLMLPGIDGFTVCRQLRERRAVDAGPDADGARPTSRTASAASTPAPTTTSSSRSTSASSSRGSGLCCVAGRSSALPTMAIGDLRIDAGTRVVTRAGEEIELTAREYDVLEFLARRPGRVVSRSELLDEIWSDYEGSPNIIDVYVGYLRKKLGRALIRTVRGSGFVLEPW